MTRLLVIVDVDRDLVLSRTGQLHTAGQRPGVFSDGNIELVVSVTIQRQALHIHISGLLLGIRRIHSKLIGSCECHIALAVIVQRLGDAVSAQREGELAALQFAVDQFFLCHKAYASGYSVEVDKFRLVDLVQ